MNGVLNVYKEQGFTSHDVVAKLRGILKTKKIGHTGTLDPDAVGVLPVCIGKATKLCDLITDWGKTYEAVMLLGTTTDTLDISGKIVAQSEVNVSEVDVLKACNEFIGEYEQIPPMYSALKHNGQKLYELARKGIEIERKPRTVHINTLRVNDINLSDKQKTVTITVDCSKGTYIRSLCDDIGKKLGCGACMMKLTRTRVGEFMLDDTLTLNQISALVLKGEIEETLNKTCYLVGAKDSDANLLMYCDVKCTGISDNIAIQELIDTVPEGSEIKFLAGNYNLKDSLKINKSLSLIGSGLNTVFTATYLSSSKVLTDTSIFK